MLNKLKKSDNKGFTIIEVMIVLAIAGLILLIVFLAVPALQRNARNTAIKNDASAAVSGISEFSSNNDGGIPTKANSTYASGTISFGNAVSTQSTTSKVQAGTAVIFGTDSTTTTVTPNAGELTITFGTKCSAPNTATKYDIVKQGRSSTIVYAVENQSGLNAKCIDS